MPKPKGHNFIDLTGQVFGRLLVLSRASNTRGGKSRWNCVCECGGTITTDGSNLRNGDTQSCGCLHREATIAKGRARAVLIPPGTQFGWLTTTGESGRRRQGHGELPWVCVCQCGNTVTVSGVSLRRGQSQSCGCLRDRLARARAAIIGRIRRPKICRTCGNPYTATGPQKECSPECRLAFHAENEANRRDELRRYRMVRELETLEKLLRETTHDSSDTIA